MWGWWLQRYERRSLWFRSHWEQTKACVQNTNKAARLGDCPWQAASSGKYHLLCGFLGCTASAPSFYSSLKTRHSVVRASTFSSSRAKLNTLVKEHSDYIRSYVTSLESVKEIGRGVESYWPLAQKTAWSLDFFRGLTGSYSSNTSFRILMIPLNTGVVILVGCMRCSITPRASLNAAWPYSSY